MVSCNKLKNPIVNLYSYLGILLERMIIEFDKMAVLPKNVRISICCYTVVYYKDLFPFWFLHESINFLVGFVVVLIEQTVPLVLVYYVVDLMADSVQLVCELVD